MIVIKQIIILVFWILIFKTSYSQCNNSGSVDWNNLQQKTGNSDWDTQISYATYNLKAFFGTDADVFYSDSEELNAFALKKKDNFSRHKVCITKGMLKFLSVDQSKYWPINLSIILSHEWGHLLQYDFEIYFSIPKHYELLSDCMSSFMFSIEMSAWVDKTYKPSMAMIDSLMTFESQFGDNDYFSKEHHGTAYERFAAGRLGFSIFADLMEKIKSNQIAVIGNSVLYKGRFITLIEYAFYQALDKIPIDFYN